MQIRASAFEGESVSVTDLLADSLALTGLATLDGLACSSPPVLRQEAMNGSIASANNATLATVAANYGLKTVVDQHSLDIAARITPLEVDTKVANALLGAVTAAALASELASRDASRGCRPPRRTPARCTAYALQSTVDTSAVDSKIAAALLDAVTTAALEAAPSAQDTQTQAAIAGALLAYRNGPGPGRVHHQPNHLGAGGVPLSRRPGHGNGLEHRRRAAQLLHHRASRRPPRRQARSHGGGLGSANSSALSGRRRGRRGGGRHRRADPGPHGRLTVKCRYRLGMASNFVVHMSEADNVYDPLYGSFVGDHAWSTAKMYFTVPPNGVAKLHFGAHFQAPGLPNQRAGTVDVYGLQILDATLEAGNTEEEDTAALALLLKHEFYAMTLSAFAWNIVRTYTLTPGRRYSFGCRYRLGTASNLVMYVSAADNDYVGVTGTFLGTPSQGVWSTARLDFSAPPGGVAKLHFGAFGGSIPGLVQQSAGTLDLCSMQIRASAFEGESVSVTHLLADSLALTGSATLDGLTAQGNVGCDQLLCNDVNCTDVFTTGVDASGAVSCAALTATGTVAHGGRVRQLAEHQRRAGLLSSATGITGSTLTINNTANAGNFTTVGDVSTGTLTASGAATAASFAATGAR